MRRIAISFLVLIVCTTFAFAISSVILPYTFQNQTKAEAPKVNANFTALQAGLNNAIGSINAAAGTKTSLEARLDMGMNPDGTFKNMSGVTAGGQWINAGFEPVFVNASSCTTPGDNTDIFLQYRRVKIGLAASTTYSTVESSTYSAGTGLTTVKVEDAVFSNPINTLEFAVFTPISANNSALSEKTLWGNDIPTNSNIASTIVKRDASGNFAAGIVTASLVGDVTAGDLTSTGNSSVANLAVSGYANLPPPGAVMAFAMATAPNGWLKCNGAAVSRTTYVALFTAIGTTYGVGDGATTFNLPDLRGEFVRGLDDGRGVDTGRALGSYQGDDNKQHAHGVTDPGHTHQAIGGSQNNDPTTGGLWANTLRAYFNTLLSYTGISIQNSGGTEARPRNVALLYCIKY